MFLFCTISWCQHLQYSNQAKVHNILANPGCTFSWIERFSSSAFFFSSKTHEWGSTVLLQLDCPCLFDLFYNAASTTTMQPLLVFPHYYSGSWTTPTPNSSLSQKHHQKACIFRTTMTEYFSGKRDPKDGMSWNPPHELREPGAKVQHLMKSSPAVTVLGSLVGCRFLITDRRHPCNHCH